MSNGHQSIRSNLFIVRCLIMPTPPICPWFQKFKRRFITSNQQYIKLSNIQMLTKFSNQMFRACVVWPSIIYIFYLVQWDWNVWKCLVCNVSLFIIIFLSFFCCVVHIQISTTYIFRFFFVCWLLYHNIEFDGNWFHWWQLNKNIFFYMDKTIAQ